MRFTPPIIVVALALGIFSTCNNNPTDNGKRHCPSLRIVAPSPYWEPVWHPSGAFIAFGHSPVYKIDSTFFGDSCFGGANYLGPPDSSGFWLIDTNGRNERMVFQFRADRIDISVPAWSPDGEWLAFVSGAQIFKMPFTGTMFDTTTVKQLTSWGRNFFPAWSPAGEWIAYDVTYPEGYQGVWVMNSLDGADKHRVATGRMPEWSPPGDWVIYVGFHGEIYNVSIADTSKVVRLTSLNQIDVYATDNRHPKYSPDGTKIAFASRPVGQGGNIWMMNADGSNPKQLTSEGTTEWLDWSPDGKKIVYVSYRPNDWTCGNGTLWIVDVFTGEKKQLTLNCQQ